MNTEKKKLENEDGWSKYITIYNTEAENLKNNNRLFPVENCNNTQIGHKNAVCFCFNRLILIYIQKHNLYMHLYLFDNKHCFHQLEEVQALYVPIFLPQYTLIPPQLLLPLHTSFTPLPFQPRVLP